MQTSGEEAAEMLARFDDDRSGAIEFGEFERLVTALKEFQARSYGACYPLPPLLAAATDLYPSAQPTVPANPPYAPTTAGERGQLGQGLLRGVPRHQ